MASFNKVILMGNLTRDPELRYTPKGLAVARIGLAVNRVWRTETGETREETTFVDCDAFGRQAENLSQYLKKGNPVLIEGRLHLHTWEDKQNQKQSRLRVDVETFRFVSGPAREGGAEQPAARPRPAAAEPTTAAPATAPTTAPATEPESEPMPSDDDVPF
jgi:single-strand DNA-binding protein